MDNTAATGQLLAVITVALVPTEVEYALSRSENVSVFYPSGLGQSHAEVPIRETTSDEFMNCCETVRYPKTFWTSVLFYTSLALVLLFSVAEVHELIPYLHHPVSQEEFPADDDFCPFCLIKYAISLALWLAPILTCPFLPCRAVARVRHGVRRICAPLSQTSRGPPQPLRLTA